MQVNRAAGSVSLSIPTGPHEWRDVRVRGLKTARVQESVVRGLASEWQARIGLVRIKRMEIQRPFLDAGRLLRINFDVHFELSAGECKRALALEHSVSSTLYI